MAPESSLVCSQSVLDSQSRALHSPVWSQYCGPNTVVPTLWSQYCGLNTVGSCSNVSQVSTDQVRIETNEENLE